MSNEGRICPQCGYGRQTKDLAPEYECPRCGIIYDKYRPSTQKPPAPSPQEDRSTTTPPEQKIPSNKPSVDFLLKEKAVELKPASLLRRSAAAIYTYFFVTVWIILIKVVEMVAFWIIYPPGSITPANVGILYTWDTVSKIVLTAFMFVTYIYRSTRQDATWGQEKFGVLVRTPYNDQESPTLQAQILRIVGVAISLAVYPFTWLWYLIGMMLKKPPLPSIADWISSTRQYETGKPVLQYRSAMLQAFLPFAIAVFLQIGLFIPVYNWFVSSYTQEPKRIVRKEAPLTPEMKAQMEQRAKERDEMIERMVKQREANAGKNTIKAISRLEQRHLEEQGDFTEDLEGLIKRYASGPNKNLTALLGPVMEDEIRVKKTAAGIEIWVVDPSSGDWMHEELRRGK